MPSNEQIKRAGGSDISEFGDKDQEGAYPPGTVFDLGEHGKLDVTKVPDIIGGKGKAPARHSSRSKRGK